MPLVVGTCNVAAQVVTVLLTSGQWLDTAVFGVLSVCHWPVHCGAVTAVPGGPYQEVPGVQVGVASWR